MNALTDGVQIFSDTVMVEKLLPLKNERQCHWIFKYLCSLEPLAFLENQSRVINGNLKSYEARKYEIKRSIIELKDDSHFKKELISKVLSMSAEALLPERKFAWIDKDNELLYRWVHTHITYHYNANFPYAVTYEDCRRDIIMYFDNSPYNRTEQEESVIALREEWQAFYKSGERFSWLDGNNKALIKWAEEHFNSNNINFMPIYLSKESEVYVGLIIAFDIWKVEDYRKELFLLKMKKALSQKKQRDKKDGKKAYNIVMSVDIKQKLNDLAEFHDMKINQTLERLINSEFERVCNKQG